MIERGIASWQTKAESVSTTLRAEGDELEPLPKLTDEGIDRQSEQLRVDSAVHIINVERSMDPDSGLELGKQLGELIASGTCNIILRVETFSCLHSTALRGLVRAQAAARQSGGKIVIVCSDATSIRKFAMIGVDNKIVIVPTEPQALAIFDRFNAQT